MNAKRLTPFLVTAACALAAVPAASAASDVQQASSGNWSGYVIGGSSSPKKFSSVSGSWVQPTAKCTTGQSYGAFWVGLGGSGQTEALEQAGTEADCTGGGAASYFAWYELVPSAPVKLDLAVHAGDHMSSQVSVDGSSVTVVVTDRSTGQSVSRTLQMSDPDTSSAEWIAEAPSACDQTASNCQPLNLTDFGTVSFTNASATSTDGHTGTISDSDWSAAAVQLSPGAGGGGPDFTSSESTAGATPSSLSSDGSSFSVAWSDSGQATSSVGSGTGYGGAYGDGYGYGGYAGGGYGGYSGGAGYGGGYGSYGGYGGGYAYVPGYGY